MSEANDWQHVGRVKPKSKLEKEQAFKKMPKVKDLDYSTRQSLMFQYDHDEMKSKPLSDRSNKQSKQVPAADDAAKGDPKQANKKKPKKSDHKLTIDKALKNENLLLEKKLEQTKAAFPDDTSIWFKETAFYLNLNLNYPDEQLVPNGRPFDFPICNTKESTAKALKNLYSKEVAKTKVPHLFNQYVLAMLENIARDIPTWGYKLCIQALAHTHPDACCQDLQLYEDKIKNLYNVPKQCTALLWALGQTGCKNSRCGMKVWLELMLPYLQHKSVAQFGMPYIELILKRANKPQETFASIVKTKEFLEIAKWRFGEISVKRSSITRDKMKAIYPTFQELMIGSKAAMRQSFGGIMDRLSTKNEELSNELSKLCILCLSKEHNCFKVWRDRYTARISQSRILVSYIDNNWETVRTQLKNKEFGNTLESFVNINLKLESKEDPVSNTNDFVELKILCQDLNLRLRESTFHAPKPPSKCRVFLWATILAAIALGIGMVVSDIKTNGGKWQNSDTYKFLKDKGVIEATDYLLARIQHLYNVVSSWLAANVPYYYRSVVDILNPYLSELMSYLYSLGVLIADKSKPALDWLLHQTGDLLHYVGEWLKIGAVYSLDFLDVCFNYVHLAAIWSYQQMTVLFNALNQIYTGEITWSDMKSAMLTQSNVAYEFLMKLLQRIGNYIAPEEP